MVKNILLILLSVALNSSAQLLIRHAMSKIGEVSPEANSLVAKLPAMLTNIYLMAAVAAYGVSFLLWAMILSKVQVSFAFPFLALSFVLVTIAGHFLFGEALPLMRIVGVALIVSGVVFIGLGGGAKAKNTTYSVATEIQADKQ